MIKTILFATICFWGASMALFPVVSMTLSTTTSDTTAPLNNFIENNTEVLVSIGTLLLISGLAVLQVSISNRSADGRDQLMRNFQAETKIADFRQAWINTLRDALAEFHSYGSHPESNPAIEREFYRLGTKIELLMNNGDPDYKTLERLLYKYLDASKKDVIEKYRLNPEFVEVSQRILKREWDRLKGELRSPTSFIDTP